MFKIAKELQSLVRSPPEDIQVLVAEQDLTEIQAWIRGADGTPYENGYFKVRLLMNEGYPEVPPKGYFITKIFHPNVSAHGEICVNTLKKDWKPDLGIAHILLAVKCLLIFPNPESALNEEAGKLLLEQYDDYAKRARLYTTIHAKYGKQEFNALSNERSSAEKQNENPSRSTTIPSPTTNIAIHTATPTAPTPAITAAAPAVDSTTNPITITKQKEDQPLTSAIAKPSGPANVLTSATSNIAIQTTGVKRVAGEMQDMKEGIMPSIKQMRTDAAVPQPRRTPIGVPDRKKQLRRL
ncbi:ubiquitin-conjugating enzyme/RWD-like protein [Dichotomocladium elegans]|nr:ubiquitin-conjugating enzyme/RWD-like protein [Dichotomocladium elegans]